MTGPKPRPLIDSDGEKRWLIEKLIAVRKDGTEYKVKWQGFTLSEASWEPADALPKESISAFHNQNMLDNRQDIVSRHYGTCMQNACTYTYHNSTVIMCEQDENFVHDGLRQYASHVIQGLKARFPKESGSVLTAFDMFHLQSLPHDEKEWSRIQETYGQEDLNTLISHYYPCSKNDIDGLCKQRRCHQQWRNLRREMWKSKLEEIRHMKKVDTSQFWEGYLNTPQPAPQAEIRGLVQRFLVIVLSSVPCERFVSLLNGTKTEGRVRMQQDLLNDLTMIRANGPCCEGVGDSKTADLIHRGWERWSQVCNRAPARSQHEERPERRKVKADILERISLPRGAGMSAREEGRDECV